MVFYDIWPGNGLRLVYSSLGLSSNKVANDLKNILGYNTA